jgi:hypothetical protein
VRVARAAWPTVVAAAPATTATKTTAAATTAVRCRFANFLAFVASDGGLATTGSSRRKRVTSAASSPADA